MYLGIDTSNYTTSAAIYSESAVFDKRRLLTVKAGELGLRQSDAFYQHVNALPILLEELDLQGVTAISVSDRPRCAEGSYMPCFLAGVNIAKTLAHALQVPLVTASHQQGHLAAAILSIGNTELYSRKFLAWHVSGGTTELLLVEPELKAECIGGTSDLNAGQVIDRAGVLFGLGFPCGAELDKLSQASDKTLQGKLTVNNLEFSLSGLQNQSETFHRQNETQANIANFIFSSIAGAIGKVTRNALLIYGDMPVLFCGGVSSNSVLRSELEGFLFAKPSACSDNAVGVAWLASKKR